MEGLKRFLSQSNSFCSISFNGCYDMPIDIFIRLYEEYKSTGVSMLDDYSEYIYLTWLNVENNDELYWDIKKCIEIEESLSKLRRLRIIDADDLGEQRIKVKILTKRYHDIEIQRKNIPRRIASSHTSKKDVRKQVFELYGEKCLCCDTIKNLTIDHIIPVFKGGINDISNYQPLCRSCNSKKSTSITDYR